MLIDYILMLAVYDGDRRQISREEYHADNLATLIFQKNAILYFSAKRIPRPPKVNHMGMRYTIKVYIAIEYNCISLGSTRYLFLNTFGIYHITLTITHLTIN